MAPRETENNAYAKLGVTNNGQLQSDFAHARSAEPGTQLVPPNFSHQVSFSRRQFSLGRLFFRHDRG